MEVKVSRDESSLENICVKNRPMNVSEAYQMFCSDAWLDAKNALDDYMDDPSEESERERLTLLHDILMIAQKVITSVYSEMVTQIRAPLEQVDQPMLFINQKEKQVKSSRKQDECRGSNFQQFENAVGDILRARADKVDCKQFRQLVYTALAENHPDVEEDIVEHVAEVDVYTERACSIVWKMVLQRPQMTFDTPGLGGRWMGDAYQEVYWGSDDPEDPSSTVAFYVHPVLYHGDKVMAKGRIMLKKSLPNAESRERKRIETEEIAKGKEPKAKAEAKEDLEYAKRGRAGRATPKRRNMKK